MSENLFGLTVAADKGLDDLQCQRLLSENRRYQEVMLQYRCALKALESRLEILNEEFSLQHDRNPIESMKSWLSFTASSLVSTIKICQTKNLAGSFVFSKSQRKWERLSARGKNDKEKPLLHGLLASM